MGCINVNAGRLKSNFNLKANINNKCNIKVNNLLYNIIKVNKLISFINIETNINRKLLIKLNYLMSSITLETKLKNKVSINTGLICTASINDDLEMWWCDGWKVLWNNKIKALWPEG